MKSSLDKLLFSIIAALCIWAAALPVFAQTQTNFDILSYTVVFAISIMGGILVAIPRYLADDKVPHQRLRLTYDLLGSVFVGTLSFFFAVYRQMDWLLAVPMIGINSLLGVGGVKLVRKIILSLKELK